MSGNGCWGKEECVGKESGFHRGTLGKQIPEAGGSHPPGPSQKAHQGLFAGGLQFSG